MRRTFDPARSPWPARPLLAAAAVLSLCLPLLTGPSGARGGDKEDGDKKPAAGGQPKIIVDYGPTMRFGLQLIDQDGDTQKITFDPKGATNIPFVKIDGKLYLFGAKEDDKLPPGIHGGRWDPLKAALGKGPDGKQRLGYKATWAAGEVRITQAVEIVPDNKGVLNTALITYTAENKDEEAHKVALRFMLDTYIGDNDGHPFQLPDSKKLIATSADFKGKKVPAVIKALQNPDVKDPGLVAYLSLKAGKGIEPPDRVSLTGFPGDAEDVFSWEVPIASIKEAGKGMGDAIAVLYWNARELKSGARRTMGYAFGGGVVGAAMTGKREDEPKKDRKGDKEP